MLSATRVSGWRDVIQVLPTARGQGAKEMMLAAVGDACHRLGLPLRIKSANAVAIKSFAKCPLLCSQGVQHASGSGRSGGCYGHVFWYDGSAVRHPAEGGCWRHAGESSARFHPTDDACD